MYQTGKVSNVYQIAEIKNNYQIAEAFFSCCGFLHIPTGLGSTAGNVTEVAAGGIRTKKIIISFLFLEFIFKNMSSS
jgi:hypothetical protein